MSLKKDEFATERVSISPEEAAPALPVGSNVHELTELDLEQVAGGTDTQGSPGNLNQLCPVSS